MSLAITPNKPIVERELILPKLTKNEAVKILTRPIPYMLEDLTCDIPDIEKYNTVKDICQIARATIAMLKEIINKFGSEEILVKEKPVAVADLDNLDDVPDNWDDVFKVRRLKIFKVRLDAMERRLAMISNPQKYYIHLLKTTEG